MGLLSYGLRTVISIGEKSIYCYTLQLIGRRNDIYNVATHGHRR